MAVRYLSIEADPLRFFCSENMFCFHFVLQDKREGGEENLSQRKKWGNGFSPDRPPGCLSSSSFPLPAFSSPPSVNPSLLSGKAPIDFVREERTSLGANPPPPHLPISLPCFLSFCEKRPIPWSVNQDIRWQLGEGQKGFFSWPPGPGRCALPHKKGGRGGGDSGVTLLNPPFPYPPLV